MTRGSKNQALDSSVCSVFRDGLRDVCVLQHHVETQNLQVTLVTKKKKKTAETQIKKVIVAAYIFASAEAMEGEKQILRRLFKNLIDTTNSAEASKRVVVATCYIENTRKN